MFDLIGAILIVITICCVLVLGLCLFSGRRGHGLNGHYVIPSVEFSQTIHGGPELDEMLNATEFFHKAEEFRRDFA